MFRCCYFCDKQKEEKNEMKLQEKIEKKPTVKQDRIVIPQGLDIAISERKESSARVPVISEKLNQIIQDSKEEDKHVEISSKIEITGRKNYNKYEEIKHDILPKLSERSKKEKPLEKSSIPEIVACQISEKIIKNGKRLTLHIKEGSKLKKGSVIEINPGGLATSPRKDGVVYFGTDDTTASDVSIKNDVSFSPVESGFGKKQFKIFYAPEDSNYFLKDLGDGSGTFVRIDSPVEVLQGNIITFGHFHLVINYSTLIASPQKLLIQVIEGTQPRDQLEFIESNSPIFCGRGEASQIKIRSQSLSRTQCHFKFESGCWWLADGDGSRTSTNGTWLFVDKPFRIHNRMVFKAGLVLFEALLNQVLCQRKTIFVKVTSSHYIRFVITKVFQIALVEYYGSNLTYIQKGVI